VRNVEVTDYIDPDLDRSQVTISAVTTDDGAGTWTIPSVLNPGILEGMDPGDTTVITIDTVALDPGTNPDPLSDGSVANTALVSAPSPFSCPDAVFEAQAPSFPINTVVGPVRMLRNDFVTCRQDAFTTIRQFMSPRPPPQECSEPPALDPLHRGTQVVVDAISPMTFVGDADPSASLAQCPQSTLGFGRIVIYYELDEPPPACITTLRVRKIGTDIEVTW
jgi:hypothetical protein